MTLPIAAPQAVDLSTFRKSSGVLEGTRWFVVVKSLDQVERRRRMIASRRAGRYGRVESRPVATGLLAGVTLAAGVVRVRWQHEYSEPRHIRRLSDGTILLTEMNALVRLSPTYREERRYTQPFLAYTHTVDVTPDERRALLVSSGFDSVLEIDLTSGDQTFAWVAWDHGFNPDEDGVWLTCSPDTMERYVAAGRQSLLVNPEHFGPQGLVTARRSAHPNAAAYDPYVTNSFVVSMGHTGALYRVLLETSDTVLVSSALAQMPHGLRPIEGGWMVTNTTVGEWWKFDRTFAPRSRYSLRALGDRVSDAGDSEWLQQVVPTEHEGMVLALDANRGLLAVDTERRKYSNYSPDPQWCIQDALQEP